MMNTVKVNEGKNKKLRFKLGSIEKSLILNEVIYAQNYFPKINNNQNFILNKNDVIIDIGANVGIFAVYAANVASNGRVYAFEPVKENFKKLEYHKSLNKLDNLIPVNKAISDKTKKVPIYLAYKNTGGHSLNKNKTRLLHEVARTKRPTEMVECLTLKKVFDEYKIQKCDFLKIDCEGEEYKILTKLPASYLKRIDKISLEFHHPVIDEIKLARYLSRHGFRVTISNFGRTLGMIFAMRIVKVRKS